jgi:hypothetical protein
VFRHPCEQLVEEPLAVAEMYVQKHVADATMCRPADKASSNALGQLIDKKSAQQFHGKLKEEIEHSR